MLLFEVGLGGCLDVINVVDYDVSVIISLVLDYIDWFGNDIVVIGYEKVGIFCLGKFVICG